MPNPYGPWATSIDVGGNPQLSAFWRQRMTMLVTASQTSPVLSRRNLLWLGAAGVLTGVLPTLRAASAVAEEEKPGVLIYEVVPISPSRKVTSTDMDKLLSAVDRRLNAGRLKVARVRKLDDRRIEVALVHQDNEERQRVERLLARAGTLEFRVLANKRDDKEIIDLAVKEPTAVLDSSGERLAWWVPVKKGEEQRFDGSQIVCGRQKRGVEDAWPWDLMKVLVVSDRYNVNGSYFKQVEADTDQKGNPCVSFTFNKAGAELFGQLTGDHLPDRETNLWYMLGIILDGELVSAPAIMSRIYDKGPISGSFTKEEVSEIVAVLNAGSLPVRLKLVEGSSIAK